MTEAFLHYVWKYRLYEKELFTTEKQAVVVSHPGIHNTDSGPDFFDARLRIGTTRWAGNVEIHLRSSDWKHHGHTGNKAYDDIILHVVYDDDMPLLTAFGQLVPCLELKFYIHPHLFLQYEAMLASRSWIPCAALINSVPPITLSSWFDRLLVSRLEKRVQALEELFLFNSCDMEETFYQWLAHSFGCKVNAQAFEMLARSLPHKLLLHHRFCSLQFEALVFGQAGMLESEFSDEYPRQLKAEYLFLQNKYGLIPLDAHLWKFMRLRPLNFPTIRLAQWADFLEKTQALLSTFLDTESVGQMLDILDVSTNDYWVSHYRFDTPAAPKPKSLGRNSAELIVINTLSPFLFFYGKQLGRQDLKDKSIHLLAQLPAESNTIIAHFAALGVKADSASNSQALLELKNSFCSLKKCLDCAIGVSLIR